MLQFLSNCLEFFDETLHLYSLFISTYDSQILFNYLKIWQSYVISNAAIHSFDKGKNID